eukprot:1161228-Pelagomonas_calceolata.AAC.7
MHVGIAYCEPQAHLVRDPSPHTCPWSLACVNVPSMNTLTSTRLEIPSVFGVLTFPDTSWMHLPDSSLVVLVHMHDPLLLLLQEGETGTGFQTLT